MTFHCTNCGDGYHMPKSECDVCSNETTEKRYQASAQVTPMEFWIPHNEQGLPTHIAWHEPHDDLNQNCQPIHVIEYRSVEELMRRHTDLEDDYRKQLEAERARSAKLVAALTKVQGLSVFESDDGSKLVEEIFDITCEAFKEYEAME